MSNIVLESLKLTAELVGIDIGDYKIINGDGYLFDNGLVISGLEIARADDHVKMIKLITDKLVNLGDRDGRHGKS